LVEQWLLAPSDVGGSVDEQIWRRYPVVPAVVQQSDTKGESFRQDSKMCDMSLFSRFVWNALLKFPELQTTKLQASLDYALLQGI